MPLPDTDSAQSWGADAWVNAYPVADPTTDQDAAILKEIACDTAGATHTQARAMALASCVTYTSGSQTIAVADHDATWGTAVAPTCLQTAAGVYTFSWPATVTDELDAVHTLNCRMPKVSVLGSTNGVARVASWTANTVTVHAYTTAWSAECLMCG